MNLSEITPLLITFDEIRNLPRTLAALHWASRIVVVDSGSCDGTLELLAADARITVLHRPFDHFAEQCTHGLEAIDSLWVLSLDADHVLSPEWLAELRDLNPGQRAGYSAGFRYCVNGKPLKASLLPPRVVLFRRDAGYFQNDGHAHRIVLAGPEGRLNSAIFHDDQKPLARWLAAQSRYAAQEAEKLAVTAPGSLNRADRLRLRLLGPLAILPYCLLICGLWRDGRAGWFYTLQRLYFETLLALLLLSRPAEKTS